MERSGRSIYPHRIEAKDNNERLKNSLGAVVTKSKDKAIQLVPRRVLFPFTQPIHQRLGVYLNQSAKPRLTACF